MKFVISELLAAADIKIVEIVKILVIGAICITAIVECGIWAVVAIAVIVIAKMIYDFEIEDLKRLYRHREY